MVITQMVTQMSKYSDPDIGKICYKDDVVTVFISINRWESAYIKLTKEEVIQIAKQLGVTHEDMKDGK